MTITKFFMKTFIDIIIHYGCTVVKTLSRGCLQSSSFKIVQRLVTTM